MFFQKAQIGFNHWWRYAIVLLAIMGGYVVGQIPLFLAIGRAQAEDDSVTADALAEFQNNPDFTLFGINNNMGLTLLLVTFLGAFTAFYFIFKPMHQREFRSIVTPSSRVNWSKILFGFFLWLELSLIVEIIAYFLSPENYIFQFKINTFIPLVILSIFLLPVQTSMEEFVFRGYLMQGIGNSKLLRKIKLNKKYVPLIITSILFGLMHSMNPEVDEFGQGIMQSYYISAGIILGIMTLMDDGLELALGVHAATNFNGAVFVGYNGAVIKTDALFMTNALNPYFMLAALFAISAIFLFICKYKYQWGSFKALSSHIAEIPEDIV